MKEYYESTKERAVRILGRYSGYSDLITFNDSNRSITFTTERLIPTISTNRPRVMLLFSNPHPYSVHQGMFLSPNTFGRENLFWSSMRDASWLTISEDVRDPRQLADIFLDVHYRGPFELIFYCYYAFPTNYPEDISKIFGNEYFNQVIEREARDEFVNTVQETSVDAVIAFNKAIFNLVAKDQVELYVDRLMHGELIQSQINCIDQTIPIFLTFPTGWRYHKYNRQFRKASLEAIGCKISRTKNNIKQK